MKNKLVEYYNWLSIPGSVVLDITLAVIVFIVGISLATVIGWAACRIFGWYLAPMIMAFLLVMCGVQLYNAHRSGGIKEWWRERP